MATVSGGTKLKEALENVARKLSTASSVSVGFIDGRTYPDGQRVSEVAITNEFGGTINVPEREQTIYRRLDAEGELTNDGRFVKRKKSNFASTHTVAAHTITIPPRPFFRMMIQNTSHNWSHNLKVALKREKYDAAKALDLLGRDITGKLQDSINSNVPPPNAKSTIRGKGGSTQTLIHSSLMLNSVTHTVK